MKYTSVGNMIFFLRKFPRVFQVFENFCIPCMRLYVIFNNILVNSISYKIRVY